MDTSRAIQPSDAAPSPTCAVCGRSAGTGDTWRLTWTTTRPGASDVVAGPVQHCCDRCSREHLRAIEAQLDPTWW